MNRINVATLRRLRIEEVDAALVLPQILGLRAMVGRSVSLAPDLSRWRDPFDARAMHWGVFRDAELVAAARLCVHAALADATEAALFSTREAELLGPVAMMSHCVVHPLLHGLRLDAALDAARIERARQLQLGALLAVADDARRAAALVGQGFGALVPRADGRSGLVLHLARQPSARVIRMRLPSRT